jgi:membrane-associated phospholipid phosphatase
MRMEKIYKGISLIFSPYVISLLSFAMLGDNIFIPFTFFFLFPIILSFPELKNFNISMEHRIAILLKILVFYIIGTLLISGEQKVLGICYIINAIIAILITRKYKISLHLFGITGPATALMMFSRLPAAAILFILAPLVAFTRYKLRAHTIGQLLLGFIVGIASTALIIEVMMNLMKI